MQTVGTIKHNCHGDSGTAAIALQFQNPCCRSIINQQIEMFDA
ncbi:hypothetical protein PRJ_5607 (plasmid) [Pseudomonas sp. XWY-1]|nr:hypothetical protein PRJ_5607 [Pseudomonas sp. XWY-1]